MKTKMKKGSMKGKKGTVGAPEKPTNWPTTPFTMTKLFAKNKKQCELSLRTKVAKKLESSELVELAPIPQRGGRVGRPKTCFVLAQNFDAETMVKAADAPKTEKKNKTKKVKATRKTRKAHTPRAVVVPSTVPVTQPPEATPVAATSETVHAVIEQPATETVPSPAPEPVAEQPAPAPEPAAVPANEPVVG